METKRLNGDTLRMCRQFFGLSQADLGERIGSSRQYINQLELGDKAPNDLTMRALAAALEVDPSYLAHEIKQEIREDHTHFRKLKTTPKWLINQVLAHGTLFDEFVDFIEEHLELPPVNFPSIEISNAEDIEKAAEFCRVHWNLTVDQPIKNITRVVENAGAVVVAFEGVSTKLDALSMHHGRPIVVRSGAKTSPTRIRFDVAHELGHIVMHKGIVTGDHKTEGQADRFAGAFLLPRRALFQEYRRADRINWVAIKRIKQRWNVSQQAIIRRAYELSLINAAQYKWAMIRISKEGQRKQELYEPETAESGELLRIAMKALKENYHYSLVDLEKLVGIKGKGLKRLIGADAWGVFDVPNLQAGKIIEMSKYTK